MATCPLCSEDVSDVRAHCEEAHEEEMRQRRVNPDDAVVAEVERVTDHPFALADRPENGECHICGRPAAIHSTHM